MIDEDTPDGEGRDTQVGRPIEAGVALLVPHLLPGFVHQSRGIDGLRVPARQCAAGDGAQLVVDLLEELSGELGR